MGARLGVGCTFVFRALKKKIGNFEIAGRAFSIPNAYRLEIPVFAKRESGLKERLGFKKRKDLVCGLKR